MDSINNLEVIKKFIDELHAGHIESTGAYVVAVPETVSLYNVIGSSHDPKRVPGH